MNGIRGVGVAVVVLWWIGPAGAIPEGHWPGVGAPAFTLAARTMGSALPGFRVFVRPAQSVDEPAAEAPGVEVVDRSGIADGLYAVMMADVVAVAKQAMEETLPGRRIERIRLVLARGREWHENVVTDRDHTIYVRIGGHGIGEAMRADAGPVALLCEAVAELYNTRRLQGLDRYVAHRHLVPAVVAQLGADAIPTSHSSPLGADGAEILHAVTEDEYTFVHPDLAAVAALTAVEDRVGLDGLRALVEAASGGTQDPFGALREAAVAVAPELADAFRAYDEATRLEADEDGTCLVASFEPDEGAAFVETHPLRTRTQGLLLATNPGIEWSFTNEWSIDGTQSLKLEGDVGDEWMALYIRDPDWKFRDLRRFSEVALDLVIDAPGPQRVSISLNDHVTDGHGQLRVFSETLMPGEWRRVTYPLNEETMQGFKDMDAEYFSGQFRGDSAARIYIGLSKPEQPITLYVDNLRVRLRQ